MKKYIDFNTKKRTNAANSFENDFFKIDNQQRLWQNHGELAINVRLVTNEKDFVKYTCRPTLITHIYEIGYSWN